MGGALTIAEYEQTLREIGYEDVVVQRIASECGEACDPSDVMSMAVAVTATKPGSAFPRLRPAVRADRDRIAQLLTDESLPLDGLGIEDAIVALSDGVVVGAIALERHGTASMLRSLVVAPGHRRQGHGRALVIAALEVARWSGAAEVYLYTEDAQQLFARFGFEPVSGQLLKDAVGSSELVSCCTTATAMHLSFESADLPLLSKPSIKPLPTFQDGACC